MRSAACTVAPVSTVQPEPLMLSRTRSGSKRAAADSPEPRLTTRKKAPPAGLPPGYPPKATSPADADASTGLTKYLEDEHLDWGARRDD